MFDIKKNLKELPTQPGVYIMRDKENIVLYVGKAINLKNRVNQYFRKNKKSPRIEKMVSKIDHFEYIITDNEAEALILECNLIKKYKPQYNVMLKDDKSYPYIKVTINEKFPRVYMTRSFADDGSKYYGPYTDVNAVKEMLGFIKNLFPLKVCKKDFKEISKANKPCLNFHIKKCLAPCRGDISVEEYKKMINKICNFLDGKYEDILDKLNKEMMNFSDNMEYEKAAGVRDKILSIKKISEKQKVDSLSHEDIDVIGIQKYLTRACIEVFTIRNGKLTGREQYKFDDVETDDNSEILNSFIKQFYNIRWHIPRRILIRHEISDIVLLENWLSEKRASKVEIIIPKKGEKNKILEMTEKNALECMKKELDYNENIILKLYNELKLNRIPKKIEAYDISNIGNEDIVGAMITIIDGKPVSSLYRKFKIKNSRKQDDISCTYEVLTRRLNNINEGDEAFSILPDLILADGGRGQVHAIKRSLAEHNLDIEVVGMIKNDKHKIKALLVNERNIRMSVYPDLLKFMFMIQEEVHRFAIEYHRKLRSKKLTKSELDNIKGIGEIRKRNLLKHFGSIDKIEEATQEELLKVESMNKESADKVYRYFKEKM
jgi:excinuclease ABC subunit C